MIDGEKYALKSISKESIKGNKQIQHIVNERNILREFSQSEHCVRYYESMQDKENLYLVMEYLPGGELLALIK